MSAPGASGRDKTAEELLAQLLPEREYVMVLEYSKANGLESDNAVFFLVALLKIYAHAHDRILTTIANGKVGLQHIEGSTDLAIARIEKMLRERTVAVGTVMREATDRMAHYTSELSAATGEMRGLKDELVKTNKEAVGVFHAYKRLADDGTATTLSQLFQKAALGALDRRVPFYDDTIRTLILDSIARETRKLVIMSGVQFVILVLMMIVFGK